MTEGCNWKLRSVTINNWYQWQYFHLPSSLIEKKTTHHTRHNSLKFFDKSKLNFLAKRYLVSAVYQVDRLLPKSNWSKLILSKTSPRGIIYQIKCTATNSHSPFGQWLTRSTMVSALSKTGLQPFFLPASKKNYLVNIFQVCLTKTGLISTQLYLVDLRGNAHLTVWS